MTAESESGAGEQQPGETRASKMMPGCIVKPTLVAVMALTGGIVLISHSEQVGGAGRVAAVVLVFFGALFSIPILMIGLGLAGKWYLERKLKDAMKGILGPARDMVERNKAIYAEHQEYRDATDADFAGLDREWYESSSRELEAAGFRQLGDVINLTIARAAGASPVIRRLISADGTTMPCMFHLVIAARDGQSKGRDMRTFDVESEFTDGTFLLTSNTEENDRTTTPPAIHRQRFPASTPIFELVRLHEAEKMKLLAAKEGSGCVRVSTPEEAVAFQARQHAIKAAFRKGIGFADPEEVRRIAKSKIPDDAATQDIIVEAVDVARREQMPEEEQG